MVLEERRVVDEIVFSLEARYPTDEEEQAEPEGWTAFDYLPSRGIWVALGTFIPTFLAVVIGVPHIFTSAQAPHATEPRVPLVPRSATMALTASATPTRLSADLRPIAISVPSETEDAAPTPRPSLETTERTTAPRPPASGPKTPKPAPAEDSAWAPAAAFADNQAAARLASTMRNQGYRVDVRRDDSTTRQWMVWIKAPNRSTDEPQPAPEMPPTAGPKMSPRPKAAPTIP
jgi:hypothetical protein